MPGGVGGGAPRGVPLSRFGLPAVIPAGRSLFGRVAGPVSRPESGSGRCRAWLRVADVSQKRLWLGANPYPAKSHEIPFKLAPAPIDASEKLGFVTRRPFRVRQATLGALARRPHVASLDSTTLTQ